MQNAKIRDISGRGRLVPKCVLRFENALGARRIKLKSHSPDAPAYGTICRTGKEWTVALQTKKTDTGVTITGSRSGYGAFPFDKYYGLPVIDFTGESFDRCFEGLKLIEKMQVKEDISLLPAFIKSYQDAGFKVHMNGFEG